jgi:hypothetical protein
MFLGLFSDDLAGVSLFQRTSVQSPSIPGFIIEFAHITFSLSQRKLQNEKKQISGTLFLSKLPVGT